MKLSLRWSVVKHVLFAVLFNLLFFLPYLGGTQFRVDQLLGVGAIVWLAIAASRGDIEIPSTVVTMLKWSLLILIWAIVLTAVTPGKVIHGMQLINSFSSLAGGVAIYVVIRKHLVNGVRPFLAVSLIFSILINAFAYYLWVEWNNPLISKYLELYGGASSAAYGEFGTIGAISQYAGRVTSVFPHSQAFALYNLMIFAVGSSAFFNLKGVFGKVLGAVAVGMSVLGGILSSGKTYTFCLILMFIFQLLWTIPMFVRRPKINLYFVGMLVAGVLIAQNFISENRYLRSQIETISQMDAGKVLDTRIGSQGYLIKSGTVAAMLEPIPLMVGMGGGVSNYAWSDNGYFQVLMFGGIPFFLCFYGYLIYICFLFLKNFQDRGPRLHLALYLSLFFGNVGTLLYLFPRSGLLLSFFTVLAIEQTNLMKSVPKDEIPQGAAL